MVISTNPYWEIFKYILDFTWSFICERLDGTICVMENLYVVQLTVVLKFSPNIQLNNFNILLNDSNENEGWRMDQQVSLVTNLSQSSFFLLQFQYTFLHRSLSKGFSFLDHYILHEGNATRTAVRVLLVFRKK
jgi:hypothetical protein